MAKLNDYEEEGDQKTATKPSLEILFNAVLDPSNPLGFLKTVFAFLASESDVFKSHSVVNDVNALVRIENDKAKKRKEKAEGKKPENIVNDEPMVEKKRHRVPNEVDSLNLDKYSWRQTSEEVTIDIPIPAGTELVLCEIKKNHLKVGLQGQPPIIDVELYQPVNPDYCSWSFKDEKTISAVLNKQDWMKRWKCLVKESDPEVTQKVEPEKSKPDDLESEIRSFLEKGRQKMIAKFLDLDTYWR